MRRKRRPSGELCLLLYFQKVICDPKLNKMNGNVEENNSSRSSDKYPLPLPTKWNEWEIDFGFGDSIRTSDKLKHMRHVRERSDFRSHRLSPKQLILPKI